MNVVDIIILVSIILGAITGFIRGFFKQTIIFVGTILVVVFAFILKNPLSLVLYRNLPFFKLWGLGSLNILLYEVLAFIIAIAVLSLIFAVAIKVTGIIEMVLKATVILALPSKLLGMIVGIIQSIVILYVVLFIASLPVFKIPFIKESKYTNIILTKTPIISSITNDVVKSFEEIGNTIIYIGKDIKDVDGTNNRITEVLLKNKVITFENVKYLVEEGKLKITNLEELQNNYGGLSVN